MRAAILAIILLLTLVAAPVEAQVVGDCEHGTAEADLDINAVQARVFNNGNLFFGNTTVTGGYIVPKHSETSAIFSSNLSISGKVGGDVRAVGGRFGPSELWPGPLDADGSPPEDCSDYDRIYAVSRGDVQRYYETGEATDDLRDWPVDLGAPVLDGDGVAGNYNLAGGDEPAISGEQTAWWVMNDAGNAHEMTGTAPLQVEVQASAFAGTSSAPAVNQATFYRYRLIYRGEQPLDSAYVALAVDANLGDAGDDYVGSDTTLDMAFAYNGQDVDDRYGVPPALGVVVLQGPVGRDGEEAGMAAFQEHQGSGPYFDTDPTTGVEYHRVMRGLWFDGWPVSEGGDGYNFGSAPGSLPPDSTITTYMLAGDPIEQACWSMENMCNGYSGQPYDQRFMLSTGPFRMEPGETVEIVFAIPFAQGTDRLDSVVQLRAAARYLQRAYDLGVFEPQRVRLPPAEPPPPTTFALRAFPNPFAASASVELTVADGAGALRLAVYDVLGREVAVLADGVLAPGEYPFTLDGAELPAGLYFVRLATGRQTESLTLVHVE